MTNLSGKEWTTDAYATHMESPFNKTEKTTRKNEILRLSSMPFKHYREELKNVHINKPNIFWIVVYTFQSSWLPTILPVIFLHSMPYLDQFFIMTCHSYRIYVFYDYLALVCCVCLICFQSAFLQCLVTAVAFFFLQMFYDSKVMKI